VFPAGHEHFIENLWFAESLVKTLLWQKGAQVVVVGGRQRLGIICARFSQRAGRTHSMWTR